jgi:hypothetical protein
MDGKGMEKRRKWGYRFLFSLSLPDEAWHNYGGPKRLMISYLFDCKEPVIYLTVKWFYKPAYWLPEAIWLSFIPRVAHPGNWRLEKIGELISPLEVIKDVNRCLHGLGRGIIYEDQQCALQIESLDAPLVAPGEPALLHFTNRQPVLRRGMHFNLYNNVWGTNFPMWYGDPACFRFILRFTS